MACCYMQSMHTYIRVGIKWRVLHVVNTYHYCPQSGKKFKVNDQCRHLVFWVTPYVGGWFTAKIKSSLERFLQKVQNSRFLA